MSKKEKAALVASGIAGAGIAAWRALFPWIGDDITTIRSMLKGKESIRNLELGRTEIIMFEESVARFPKKTFIIFEDRHYSYELVDAMANKVANLAMTWNLPRHSPIAMMIENEPAFIWTFYGLRKAGLSTVFINNHIKGHPLVHSLKVSEASVLIIGPGEHVHSLQEMMTDLPEMKMYMIGSQQVELPQEFISMDDILLHTLPVPFSKACRGEVNLRDPVSYIFTSGTTGLPKPAIVNQFKTIASATFWKFFDFNENDISYAVTPLYHSASFLICLLNTSAAGATMVLRRKFSARHYWEDVRKHGVTVIQYIGELCRYLLRVPKSDLDGVHNVRVAFGNGLRMDIWEEFKNRFKIPRIVEFFGATEGTGSLINLTNTVGAVGRMSPLMRAIIFRNSPNQTHFLKFDMNTEKPLRDKNGLCIPIKPGEVGLVISSVNEHLHSGFYKGSREMDEKKLVRDVFKQGDRFFSFGDLIYMDKNYNLYFRDRLGDTFRWKSENVSTSEVANVISQIPFIGDVNVYGVTIPGEDGRAGMAAILLKHEDNQITEDKLRTIYYVCQKELPVYARPLFLRFMPEFIITQTMKNKKIELVEQGYDLEKVEDPLYHNDPKNKTYSPLTKMNYEFVLSSKL